MPEANFTKADVLLDNYTFKKISNIRKAKELYEEGKEVYVQPSRFMQAPYFKIKGAFDTAIQTYRFHCTGSVGECSHRFFILEENKHD